MPLTIAPLLLASSALAVSSQAPASGTDGAQSFEQVYEEGSRQLSEGHLDEGIAAFARVLELRPAASDAAYKLACCYARKGQLDPSFTWLERALFEWSWRPSESSFGLLSSDVDLEALRADSRFASVLARFRTRVQRESRLPVPSVYIDWIGGHTRSVSSAAFSPDGERIVTASRDLSGRVWSARSGETLLVLNGHSNTVTSAVFSSDGEHILSGDFDRQTRMWDARIASELMQFARYAVLEKSAGCQVPTFPRIEGGENFPLARAPAK